MSVNTAADEKRDSALKHVDSAIKDLSAIVIDRCWGHEEFNDVYIGKLKDSLNSLIDIRDKL